MAATCAGRAAAAHEPTSMVAGRCPVCGEAEASWRCEECRTPWAIGAAQCQRCGNRTREPDPPARGS